ncbi:MULTISPECIES: 5-formyltetrahydrofolate cyclo-ligase [Nocardiopsis]|uniref:5-formyltetrahydrofolate cyclo-ligase n=1 Tax=Nocardiopsis sinuspersici TaxID=501010 RepID=A0A1V3C164_9ACTN|nr:MULTISPECIES: 5-formyltetrahydrofolate cyclo-ligase [Nocardiopsis]OOC54537.1 5-formyltetrahydrofolate cyclo-ligase [Nocardiopsis sinuspersici]
MSDIDQAKEAVRDRVWRLLEREGAVPEGSYGKIPGFYGNEATAERLAELDVWKRASTVKANPDWAQLPIRTRALQDGKLLYMAVPRMASLKPFYLLDPALLSLLPEEAAEKKGAEQIARRVGVDGMRPVDVVICGSVAVNRSGARIGKGAGYSDLEVALLIEAGLVTEETTIVAPVHQLQVIDEEIPETEHDFSVDLIVTPNEVIQCERRQHPNGIVWEDLTAEKVEAIPVLGKLARAQLPRNLI